MNKKGTMAILVIALFLVGVLFVGMAFAKKPSGEGDRGRKACNDRIDNDGDGYTDWQNDPGCENRNDRSELNPEVECDDGTDNDGDDTIDYNDEGCSGPTDDDETNCGDLVCEGGEDQQNCPEDCGYPDSCDDTDSWYYPREELQGIVDGHFNGDYYSYTDYCVDNNLLKEYYCLGNYSNNYNYNCQTNTTNTCNNGACIWV